MSRFKVALGVLVAFVLLLWLAVAGFWVFVGWGVFTHADDIGHAVGGFAKSIEQGYNQHDDGGK